MTVEQVSIAHVKFHLACRAQCAHCSYYMETVVKFHCGDDGEALAQMYIMDEGVCIPHKISLLPPLIVVDSALCSAALKVAVLVEKKSNTLASSAQATNRSQMTSA